MRNARVVGGLVICLSITVGNAIAADAPVPDNPLAGTRWMEIGVFDTIENIAPEKMLVLRLCAIADIAFIIEDGKLTKYDRAGLSGKGAGPTGFVKVDQEPGRDGATLVTLHTSADANDVPDRYLIDAGGEIMRMQLNGGNGSAYMKCRMPQTPAPPAAPAERSNNGP